MIAPIFTHLVKTFQLDSFFFQDKASELCTQKWKRKKKKNWSWNTIKGEFQRVQSIIRRYGIHINWGLSFSFSIVWFFFFVGIKIFVRILAFLIFSGLLILYKFYSPQWSWMDLKVVSKPRASLLLFNYTYSLLK